MIMKVSFPYGFRDKVSKLSDDDYKKLHDIFRDELPETRPFEEKDYPWSVDGLVDMNEAKTLTDMGFDLRQPNTRHTRTGYGLLPCEVVFEGNRPCDIQTA